MRVMRDHLTHLVMLTDKEEKIIVMQRIRLPSPLFLLCRVQYPQKWLFLCFDSFHWHRANYIYFFVVVDLIISIDSLYYLRVTFLTKKDKYPQFPTNSINYQ